MSDKPQDQASVEENLTLNTDEGIPELNTLEEAIAQVEGSETDTVTDGTDDNNSPLTQLTQALTEAQAQAEQQRDLALRTTAEMDNLRKRTRKEVQNAKDFALEKFVKALVPVLDSMDMGLESAQQSVAANDDGGEAVPGAQVTALVEGLTMTQKQLIDVFSDFNVERLNPVGEAFNPQVHEAMTLVPSTDHEPNTIMTVVQKGYVLNGRLVRPARVVVSKAAE